MAIDLGDLYHLAYDHMVGGALVNAGTMTLTITLPDGTSFSAGTITPGATGKYQYDYQTTQPGRHVARWLGTGTNPGANVDVFDVRAADIPYLVSLADAKAQLNITSTASDDELRPYVEAATGVVERHLNTAVVRRPRTEEHVIGVRGPLVLNWSPVVSLTAMTQVDGTFAWDVSTLHCTPAGVVTSPFGTPPYGHVSVTYLAGMSIIPEEYALATLIIVQHLWETQRPAGGAPRAGGLNDSLTLPRAGSSGIGFAIPNRALELLGEGMPGIA